MYPCAHYWYGHRPAPCCDATQCCGRIDGAGAQGRAAPSGLVCQARDPLQRPLVQALHLRVPAAMQDGTTAGEYWQKA